MEFTRRNVMVIGAGAFAASALPSFASKADDAVAALTGGADLGADGITLTAPEIAENGNTVPVEVSAPGAVNVTILADGNPTPGVASFKFGALSPNQAIKTRIRLSTTQNVIAVAEMADGSFVKASATVKVTIGGCGG